ncbi:MAG: hypothetical protein QXT74_02075 [Candidatus Nezhaarchaeales archaeon]
MGRRQRAERDEVLRRVAEEARARLGVNVDVNALIRAAERLGVRAAEPHCRNFVAAFLRVWHGVSLSKVDEVAASPGGRLRWEVRLRELLRK